MCERRGGRTYVLGSTANAQHHSSRGWRLSWQGAWAGPFIPLRCKRASRQLWSESAQGGAASRVLIGFWIYPATQVMDLIICLGVNGSLTVPASTVNRMLFSTCCLHPSFTERYCMHTIACMLLRALRLCM